MTDRATNHKLNGLGPFADCPCADCRLAIQSAKPTPYRIYGNDGRPIVADWVSA